jgi:hypothetical protein
VEPSQLDYQTPRSVRLGARSAKYSIAAGIASSLSWLTLHVWIEWLSGTFLGGMVNRLDADSWIAFAIPAFALFGLVSGIVAIARRKTLRTYAVIGVFVSGLNLIAFAVAFTLFYLESEALASH